jgi:hypothetical protein
MDAPIPISMPEAFDIMRSWGYEDGATPGSTDQFRAEFISWHTAGAAVLLFSNRDIRSTGHLPLGIAKAWDVPDDVIAGWPPCSPDTDWLVGWRYVPTHYVLPDGA